MDESRIAIISDVHGNRWALQAVLADIERRRINRIVNLGDCVYGPLDPAGTADLLIRVDCPTVRGNEDRIILEPRREDDSPTLRRVRKLLTPDHITWLASLPFTVVAYDEFFLCHGTPERDNEYLLWEAIATGVRRRTTEELITRLPPPGCKVLFCGHDHVPAVAHADSGMIIVNPGSVGLPAFIDDLPFPHVMETGTPHARYSVVLRNEHDWVIENIAVSYDWPAAAETAQANGRPDWAFWLRTGRTV